MGSCTLAVFTSNSGKFRELARMLGLDASFEAVWIRDRFRPKESKETESASENARIKAIRGSLRTDCPVLATDEELLFEFLEEAMQPGALVRRVVDKQATDQDMVLFYEELLRRVPPNRRRGIIKTHYALAVQGLCCGATTIIRSCSFTLPPSRCWISGRPLSAFHFIPEFGKRYSELSESELNVVERPVAQKLLRFVKLTVR